MRRILVSFLDMMRLANLKNGVPSHHLKILEKTESVKVERLPRQTRLYPQDFSDEESLVAKALRKKTPRDSICALMLNYADRKKGLEFSQIVANVSKAPHQQYLDLPFTVDQRQHCKNYS